MKGLFQTVNINRPVEDWPPLAICRSVKAISYILRESTQSKTFWRRLHVDYLIGVYRDKGITALHLLSD